MKIYHESYNSKHLARTVFKANHKYAAKVIKIETGTEN